MVANTHRILTQEIFPILDLSKHRLKRVSGIDHPYWSGMLIQNRNILQTSLLHERPDITQ